MKQLNRKELQRLCKGYQKTYPQLEIKCNATNIILKVKLYKAWALKRENKKRFELFRDLFYTNQLHF